MKKFVLNRCLSWKTDTFISILMSRRRKDRHEASGFSRRPDPDSDEDEDYERERRKRSKEVA